MSIVVVDYGVGNLRNVYKALEAAGAAARVITTPDGLVGAAGIVLPGVGAFGDAAANLRAAGFEAPLLAAVAAGTPLLGICVGMQLLFDESEEMGRHRGLGIIPGRVVRFGSDLPPRSPSLRGNLTPRPPSLRENLTPRPPSLSGKGEDNSPPLVGEGSGERWHLTPRADDSPPLQGEGLGERLKIPQIGWNQLHHNGTDPLLAGVPDGAYAYFVHSYYCAPDDASHIVATTDYGIYYASVVRRGNVWGIQCHPEKSQAVGLRILRNFVKIVG